MRQQIKAQHTSWSQGCSPTFVVNSLLLRSNSAPLRITLLPPRTSLTHLQYPLQDLMQHLCICNSWLSTVYRLLYPLCLFLFASIGPLFSVFPSLICPFFYFLSPLHSCHQQSSNLLLFTLQFCHNSLHQLFFLYLCSFNKWAELCKCCHYPCQVR